MLLPNNLEYICEYMGNETIYMLVWYVYMYKSITTLGSIQARPPGTGTGPAHDEHLSVTAVKIKGLANSEFL